MFVYIVFNWRLALYAMCIVIVHMLFIAQWESQHVAKMNMHFYISLWCVQIKFFFFAVSLFNREGIYNFQYFFLGVIFGVIFKFLWDFPFLRKTVCLIKLPKKIKLWILNSRKILKIWFQPQNHRILLPSAFYF